MFRNSMRFWGLIVMPLAILFAVTACGDDDDDDVSKIGGGGNTETPAVDGNDGIVGTWKVTIRSVHDNQSARSVRDFNAYLFDKCQVTFGKNGTFTNHTSDESVRWSYSPSNESEFVIGQRPYTIVPQVDGRTVVSTTDSRYTFYYLLTPSSVGQTASDDGQLLSDVGFVNPNTTYGGEANLVDLGLSVPWADMNVGGDQQDIRGKMNHRFTLSYSFVSWNNLQGTHLDEARYYYGGYWSEPTKAEFEELLSKCKWTLTKYPGISIDCYLVTGPNGNRIYMPIGRYLSATQFYNIGKDAGCYTLDLTKTSRAIGTCKWTYIRTDKYEDPKDNGFYIRAVEKKQSSRISTATKVDLGIGTLWAGSNFGASDPSEIGKFVHWANPTTTRANRMELVSGTESDIVRVYMGNHWRIPNKEQAYALLGKCKWDYITLDGMPGYKITGPNGNAIFLPSAGKYDYDNLRSNVGYAFYWLAGDAESQYEERFPGTVLSEGRVTAEWSDFWLPVRPVWNM